jgi:ActR/RegA family two-component response regulator
MATRILFVDDEAGIRMTLAPILERHGFEVTTAASVPEALKKINHEHFDVLLSDLNIGQPGDGFTVVSAMRRVQPEACTFILTGYPDFETALQAIRSQVDDYLLKPMDVPTLIDVIQRRLEKRRPLPPLKPLKRVSELIRENESQIAQQWRPQAPEAPVKRVSGLLRENLQQIAQQWLAEVKTHRELMTLRLSDADRMDHVLPLIEQLALRIDNEHGSNSSAIADLGQKHGKQRAVQGYSIPLVIIEMRLLQRVISVVLQRNLIRMDLSTVIADMLEVGEALHEELEFSIRSFQMAAREAA